MEFPAEIIQSFCYKFFKILGLAPFNVKTRMNKQSRIFLNSYIGAFYNILLIIIVLILSPNGMRAIYEIDFLNKTSTTQAITIVKASIGVVVLFITWFYVILTQQNSIRIANELMSIDATTMEIQNIRNFKSSNIQLSFYFLINVFIWINLIWTDYVAFEEWFKSTFFVIIIPSFVFAWFLMQYTFVLILLEIRFRALNHELFRISSVEFTVPYYLNSSENTLDDSVTKDLLIIKLSHEVLYGIACNISGLYSFPVFLIITILCGIIINSSYYFVVTLLRQNVIQPLIVFNCVCWLSMEIFPITVLALAVTKITNEMKLTAVAIHKLLVRSFIKPELKTQLKLFSLELLHRHVSFTACSIFSLDGTLLHSLLNTTATYLIILFQFGQPNKNPSDQSINGDIVRSTVNSSLKIMSNVNEEL